MENIDKLFKQITEENKKIENEALKKDIEEFNEKLYRAVYDFGYEPTPYELGSRISEMSLKVLKKDDCLLSNTHKFVNIDETERLVREFLKTLPGNYSNLLDEANSNYNLIYSRPDESIVFNDVEIINETSYYDDLNLINITLTDSLDDASSLVHELFHYTNCRSEVYTDVSNYFTEAFSTFAELLFSDFIEENYPKYKKDARALRRNSCFYNLYEVSVRHKIFELLLTEISEGRYIDVITIKNICEFMNKKYNISDDYLLYLIQDIFESVKDNFVLYEEDCEEIPFELHEYISNLNDYTVALGLASYMYMYSKEYGVDKILSLNESLRVTSCKDFINNLDLLIDDGSVEDEEYYDIDIDKIEKSFIKLKKKLW